MLIVSRPDNSAFNLKVWKIHTQITPNPWRFKHPLIGAQNSKPSQLRKVVLPQSI